MRRLGRAPAVESPGPDRISGGIAATLADQGLIQAPEHPRQGYRLLCCALWIDDGAIPKYLRNTRLKCDELEKPHENATSVMVLPAWVSSSRRQFCNLACRLRSLMVVPLSLNNMCR